MHMYMYMYSLYMFMYMYAYIHICIYLSVYDEAVLRGCKLPKRLPTDALLGIYLGCTVGTAPGRLQVFQFSEP